MYREHLLFIEHVQKLLYHQVDTAQSGRCPLRAPLFFISQNDKASFSRRAARKNGGFRSLRKVSARLAAVACRCYADVHRFDPSLQRKGTQLPTSSDGCDLNRGALQTLLSLREISHDEDQNTLVTLLEYLKQLRPLEWQNFVKTTKILAEESTMFNGPNPFNNGDEKGTSKVADLQHRVQERGARVHVSGLRCERRCSIALFLA